MAGSVSTRDLNRRLEREGERLAFLQDTVDADEAERVAVCARNPQAHVARNKVDEVGRRIIEVAE